MAYGSWALQYRRVQLVSVALTNTFIQLLFPCKYSYQQTNKMSVVFNNVIVTMVRNQNRITVEPVPETLPERVLDTPSSFGNGDDVWLFLRDTPSNRHQLGSFAPAISWLCNHLKLIPKQNMDLNVVETNSVLNALSRKFLLLNELRKRFKPTIGGKTLDKFFTEPLTDAQAILERRS